MEQNNPMGSFRRKDVIQVISGIPIVMIVAILLANWVTSYAGI